MLSISIVIPTMNRLESLKRTIHYIVSGSILPKEIIIIDQSKDVYIQKETESFIKDIPIKCILLHQSEPSLTKARNYGMKYVSSDITIQMDDDVDIKSNTLSNIIDIFSKNDNISMIAGIDEDTNENATGSVLGYFFLKKNWFKRKIGHVTLSMFGRFPTSFNNEVTTEWSMGFFSVYRTHYIQEWNLKWDENLKGYAYPEDLDFSYSYYKNSKKLGLKCIMSDRVIIKHNVSKEWRIPTESHTRMIVFNREYLRQKHFGRNILSKIATNWADYGELFRRILNKEKPSEQFKAIIDKKRRIKNIRKGILL